MRKLIAALMIFAATPAFAGEKCQTFYAPDHSRYAGDWFQFMPDGKITYNGETTRKLFARRCADTSNICIYMGSSIVMRTTTMGGLRYITLFEGGLETETLPWHSRIEDCDKGKSA